ncbi:hypothetical protein ACFY2M_42750 [Streptomyces sp. NPDC001276]|uniref:hypothetical protein n=1 Tax=Streptomyces sp. NPDC001276 TaxID=3364555 RepID=UPI0036A872E4
MGEVRDHAPETDERPRSDSPRSGTGDRGDLRSDDSYKAKGGEHNCESRNWTTPDGHHHAEGPTKDDAGNKSGTWHTETWKDESGNHVHADNKDTDGKVTKSSELTDTTDKNGHNTRDITYKDGNGATTSNSHYESWKDKDGQHTRGTQTDANGTSTFSQDSHRGKDGKEHFEITETDANGTRTTQGERWKDQNGKQHESSVTTGPIKISPSSSDNKK